MKSYKIIFKPTLIVVGIECRTSNDPEHGPLEIPKLWENFFLQNISHKIPNKLSEDIIALYCNYETDHNGPYSLIIGHAVEPFDKLPEGLVSKVIPAGPYAVFRAMGEQPRSLINTWHHIWQLKELKRTYTGDYEVHNLSQADQIEVFVAISEAASNLYDQN